MRQRQEVQAVPR
ncbi:hypothetical protein MHZ91_19160 [Achromobacter sp. ACRQX]|nr:hypothetical protein [Achromobacter sp. ACRQX]